MVVRKAASSRAASTRAVRQPATTAIKDEISVSESMDDVIEGEIIEDHVIGHLKVKMRRATEDQLMVLLKHARLAEKAGTKEAALRATEVFFRIIEQLVVDPDDIERIDDGLADKTVTVKQITGAMEIKGTDGPATAAARTRRGR